jgi:tRNA-2-methylthio-N6-dimethylallyladenosine synthase
MADTNAMAGILEAIGFEPVDVPKDVTNDRDFNLKVLPRCSVFIINTCSVRQKSEDKVYGLGKEIRELKEKKKSMPFIIVSGCVVGSAVGERKRVDFEELQSKTPWADLYLAPSQIHSLPALLAEHKIIYPSVLAKLGGLVPRPKRGNDPRPGFEEKLELGTDAQKANHAFVNISTGCDNFCSYCVVPYARGPEVSRSKQDIFADINRLMNKGITEITLCGQNVNSWGLGAVEKFNIRMGSDQKLPFADLLRRVAKLPQIKKVGFLSSNPFDFTQDLIDVLADPKISNYLHIAVQSGNNEILAKMNRRHTVEDFLKLVERIRTVRPDIELGTDLIVGFPTETREQFMDTVKMVEKVKFNVAFIAMYSQRKGTAAAKNFKDDVPLEEKKWRNANLIDVWKKTKQSKQ